MLIQLSALLVSLAAAVPTGKISIACNAEPPEEATPPPVPTYEGVCPALLPAPIENTLMSSGDERKFLLAVPANLSPDEKLPVVFLWHWLGGTPEAFYTRGEIQMAVDTQRFLAVIPFKRGDLPFSWPFNLLDSEARMNREYKFFEDMLACVGVAFTSVNHNCVASAGVSAGALFTDQLGHARAEYLSSIVSLSGGVGGLIRPWGNPTHKVPALVLWGGSSNRCVGISFEQESANLEAALSARGNFFLECVHNCGHSEPPTEPMPGLSRYAGFWQFAFDHPYWLRTGESPYLTGGLPATLPTWCGIGAGSAVPREGECPPPGC